MLFTTKAFDNTKKAGTFFKYAKAANLLHGVIIWGDMSVTLYSKEAIADYENDSQTAFCRESKTY